MRAPKLPHVVLPRTPVDWDLSADIASWCWETITPLSPFMLADGSGPALQATTTRVCYDTSALYVRFDCDDSDIWGTYTQRDDALFDEEVVEIFLSCGTETPRNYYEFEVSPNGALLDAQITNPSSRRADLHVDFAWNCPGLRWHAQRDDAAEHWWAVLAIPWASVGPDAPPATFWRANFYRIERPRHAEPEYSCWSPTLTEPADFHKPAYFGMLVIGG